MSTCQINIFICKLILLVQPSISYISKNYLSNVISKSSKRSPKNTAVDLFNREIIGYSAGRNKDAILVSKAFSKVKVNLNHIKIFHTDRGNEFKNKLIDKTLESFQIQRSLSMKGKLV